MTATELIEYIQNNNLIKIVLDDLGCHDLREYSTELRCGLPGHKNKTSIAIKRDTLKVKIFQSDGDIIRGNLLTLIMTIKSISFVDANKYLHKLFGLKYQYKKHKQTKEEANKEDPLEIFKKIKRKRNCVNTNDIEIYDSTIIEEYEPVLFIDWVKEDGIMEFTRKRFNIGYSYKHKRIVIPVRHWSGEDDDYIGIIGRTTVKNYDLLDIPKYYPLKPYLKSLNIYGLQENYQGIQEANMVIVAESEKSTLKRHSRLDETVVAIGSHSLSEEQIKILIGLNVEIVIAMDQGIDINYIRSMCERFYGIRQISYIFDKWELLKDKEAPMDKPNKIYQFLLKHRIDYDEKEHKEYLKYLKEIDNAKNK
ncbi:MAG: DNA primase [Clostridium sp.]|uniref:DNA primase n=1 Tax=Clostridium sp. TaxID=1506 RepID=UPI0025BC6594|nr:DNA primase [Clostridium sp.]MCE5220227.1 DNA primase [Clostridium sp.]